MRSPSRWAGCLRPRPGSAPRGQLGDLEDRAAVRTCSKRSNARRGHRLSGWVKRVVECLAHFNKQLRIYFSEPEDLLGALDFRHAVHSRHVDVVRTAHGFKAASRLKSGGLAQGQGAKPAP